jgi:hypothetical protein
MVLCIVCVLNGRCQILKAVAFRLASEHLEGLTFECHIQVP